MEKFSSHQLQDSDIGEFFLLLSLHHYGESTQTFVSKILSMKREEIELMIISILHNKLLDDQEIIYSFGSKEFLLTFIYRYMPLGIDRDLKAYFEKVDQEFSISFLSTIKRS